MPITPPAKDPAPSTSSGASWRSRLFRFMLWAAGLAMAGTIALAMVIAVALASAFPNLPDISDLADYRPKLPLRIFQPTAH